MTDSVSEYLQVYLFLCTTPATAPVSPQTAACLRLKPLQSVQGNLRLHQHETRVRGQGLQHSLTSQLDFEDRKYCQQTQANNQRGNRTFRVR